MNMVYLVMFDDLAYADNAESIDCLGIFDSKEKAWDAVKSAGIEGLFPHIVPLKMNEVVSHCDGEAYGINFGCYKI